MTTTTAASATTTPPLESPPIYSPSRNHHVHSKSLADPITLTLKPPAPNRGHRHRRSAAISGDFDSTSFLQNIQASANSPAPPAGYEKFISDFSNNESPNNYNNVNSTLMSLSMPNSPVRDDKHSFFQPDPIINLDDIINLSSPITHSSIFNPSSSTNINSSSSPSPTNNITTSNNQKYSILQSPKTEIVILEEETSNLNSLPLDYASNNSSTNSLNPLSTLNTASINSLKGKVRYQSYYNMAAPSTPKNYNNSTFAPKTPSSPSTPKHSNQHRLNHQRLSHSLSLSPIKPTIKSPFQYKSKSYEISEDESPITSHSNTHSITNSHHSSSNSTSTSTSNLSYVSSNHSHNVHQITPENIQQKNNNHGHHHQRSSSLFSLLSKKFNTSINKHKSSTVSIDSNSKDDTISINHDITITAETIGEPGPMVDTFNNSEITTNNNNNHNNIPKSTKSTLLKSEKPTNSKHTSSKKRFINWLSKNKRNVNVNVDVAP